MNMLICQDCHSVAIGSPDALDYHYSEQVADERLQACTAGLLTLPVGYVGEQADEHSMRPCVSCRDTLHGVRYFWHAS